MGTFTATQWATSAEKEWWFNKFKAFIESDCERKRFTKLLYTRLSMMFGHIAHYDLNGFYSAWFEDVQKRYSFIKHTMAYPTSMEDPEYTWSDVENSIILWLRDNPGIVRGYETAARVELAKDDMIVVETILNRNSVGFHKAVRALLKDET